MRSINDIKLSKMLYIGALLMAPQNKIKEEIK
jgi:hypothetical protein